MTKWGVLLLAVLGAAALSVAGGHWALRLAAVRALPEMTVRQLMSAGFDRSAVDRRQFRGRLREPSGVIDPITIQPYDDHVDVTIVHSGAEGTMAFAGPLQRSGQFKAGPHVAALEFRFYHSIEGRLHGPALVRGVPTIYMEAHTKWHTTDGVERYRPRSWTGLLFQTGLVQ
jgi:hypothetical protein